MGTGPRPTRNAGTDDQPQEPTPDTSDAAAEIANLIVAVGASAGGLDAFSELLTDLPAHPGFAIVLIMHLQPTHESNLAEILQRKSSMPVQQAEDGMVIEADHVYAIPPNVEMRVEDGTIALNPRPASAMPSLVVDIFMESLAQERGSRAIGVILSGSGSDGVRGMTAIRERGGTTLAESLENAAYTGMPESAMAAGVVDAILPIEDIAAELVRLSTHPYVRTPETAEESAPHELSADDESAFSRILAEVNRSTGLDLRHYKRPTLLRRIARRTAMKHVAGMGEYAELLEADPTEVVELLGDVLVRVTSFFRDPDMFEALRTEAFPSLLNRNRDNGPIRIWVPACATGQEVYSIAIVLAEYLELSGSEVAVQIFASDLRDDDLAFARRGVYPVEIATEMSAARLERFFNQVDAGYQIKPAIRDMCLFARHDVTRDPPFARLDLVSCRNLLIYLEANLQRSLLRTFHYALLPGGVLVLGNSEGTGAAPGLFKRTGHKGILVRLPGDARPFNFAMGSEGFTRPSTIEPLAEDIQAERRQEWDAAQRQLDEMLLDRFAPAAVLVDENLMVKQIRGNAGEYLQLRPGAATLDLSKMTSVGLASAVTSAVSEAHVTGKAAHRDAVRAGSDGGHLSVGIAVVPIVLPDLPLGFAVLFNDGPAISRGEDVPGTEPTETEYLRQELDAALERLRFMREGRDTVQEALRAANEEIQSSNEELQSMNEELETAKEELQSANEELTTLNDELQVRNAELTSRNDDLDNLLESASIAVLVLDENLSVRRFTRQAAELFNLIPGDAGRSILDIRSRLVQDDLGDLLAQVLKSGASVDREVRDDSGRWFGMTIRPYVTSDRGVGGAIVTLLDIDLIHRSRSELERSKVLSEGINRISLVLSSADKGEAAVAEATGVVSELTGAERTTLIATGEGDGSTDPLPQESAAEGVSVLAVPLRSSEGTPLGALRLEFDGPGRTIAAEDREFATRAGAIMALYLERTHHAEILNRLVAERTADLQEAMRHLESVSHVQAMFLANMSHELRTPLNSIIGFSSVLLEGMAGEINDEQHRQLEMVLNSGRHLLAIISDLLDLEKITAGAMPVRPRRFVLGDVVRAVVDLMRPVAEAKGIELAAIDTDPEIDVFSDELKVRQVLLNLVSNAVKFTDSGRVTVTSRVSHDQCAVDVSDTGRGMSPAQIKEVFKEFHQVNDEKDALTDGTGLGLSIASRLCELLGGTLTAQSTLGVGSTFTAAFALEVPAAG